MNLYEQRKVDNQNSYQTIPNNKSNNDQFKFSSHAYGNLQANSSNYQGHAVPPIYHHGHPQNKHQNKQPCQHNNNNNHIPQHHNFNNNHQEQLNDQQNETNFQQKYQQMDISKSINIMTNLFPDKDRPNGDDDEPFMHRLQPIINQLYQSNIPTEHQVGAVLSVLKGHARETAFQIYFPQMQIDQFIHELKSRILFDHNVE
ncbi:MAG: hypothetical protein AAGG81_03650 [Chlamydiota bacterium]